MSLFACGSGGGGDPSVPTAVSVLGVSLNKATLSLIDGTTETLTATINPKNATNKDISWSSSDTSIATIDANGKVSAVKAGIATIIVTTADENKTASCTVSVTTATIAVYSITLNKTSFSLNKGASEILTAAITPENATNKNVTWSSNNADVTSVDANGKVTAVKAGTATITATTTDGNKTATCAVTVTVPVSSVALNKASLPLEKSKSEILTATVSPNDATNKKVSWTSSNSSAASVDNNGKITAEKTGTATITVTTEDGSKTATCSVTVISPVSSVSLNKTSLTLFKGTSQTLIATINPSDATNKEVTWSSSNSSVASIDTKGKVTTVKVGTATITVTTEDGGKTATCAVIVQSNNNVTYNPYSNDEQW
jgi:uncharacterized protein YjdB